MKSKSTKGTMRALLASAAAVGLLAVGLTGTAAAADSNHDGIPDRWEKRHGLSIKVNQAKRDQDRDALVNKREFRFGMDPQDDDSDDDGVEDGDEQSGSITAWDPATGSLTITTVGGEAVTGVVTEDTEVECDDGDDHGDEDGDGEGGHHGPGHGDDDDDDHSGPGHDGGDDEAGEDEPSAKSVDGAGEEDGDDHGEDEDGEECSVDDLAVGALVQEAELEIEGGQAVWEEIELLVSESDA